MGFAVRHQAPLDRHAVLFRQGDRFEAVYLIVSGCILLRESDADGHERIVAARLPGELVGLEGWARSRHPYSAEVAAPTRVCELVWPNVDSAGGSTRLLDRLLRKATAQLERSSSVWAQFPAVDRVAAFIDHLGRHLGVPFELPLTRAEIGSLLGLAEETVVRAFAELRAERRISIRGREISSVRAI
jgi:CRP/FNR family transcriptional regulator